METRKLLLIVGIIAAVVGVTAAVEYTTHTISNELTVVEGSAQFTSTTTSTDWETQHQNTTSTNFFIVTNEGTDGDYVQWEDYLPSDIDSNMWYCYMTINTINHSELKNTFPKTWGFPRNNSTLSVDGTDIGVLHWWPEEGIVTWGNQSSRKPYLAPGESLVALYEINIDTTCQPDDYNWDLDIGKG